VKKTAVVSNCVPPTESVHHSKSPVEPDAVKKVESPSQILSIPVIVGSGITSTLKVSDEIEVGLNYI
jgi:hypothetical protein